LTFKSSDNILFKIYKTHLHSASGFHSAPNLIIIENGPIFLEESAHILEILFQFVHPPTETNRYRQPNLGQLPDETFFEVAEAAEKYTFFSAMNATILGMQ